MQIQKSLPKLQLVFVVPVKHVNVCIIFLFSLALSLGNADRKIATRCYVCGTNSSVSAQCVDNYVLDERSHDVKTCIVTEKEHGCVKSKFVDIDGTQIGKLYLPLAPL